MKHTEYSPQQLRERTDQELLGVERQIREDLFQLRLQRSTNQLEDVSKVRRSRRDLARVKTILRARGLGIEAAKPETREA